MKYTIGSCKEKTQVEAQSIEKAYVEALKVFSLDKCNQFIYGYEEGKHIDDSDTMWGLTEWYLKDAGYIEIKEHLWKKQNTNPSSFGNDGLIRKKEKVAPMLRISHKTEKKKSISGIGLIEHSLQDIALEDQNLKEKDSLETVNLSAKRHLKKVDLKRTPEEWKEVLNQAKNKQLR